MQIVGKMHIAGVGGTWLEFCLTHLFIGVDLSLIIISVFGLLVIKTNKNYSFYLFGLISCYLLSQVGLIYYNYEEVIIQYSGSILEERSVFLNKIIISSFGLYFLLYWYLEINILNFKPLEGTFFVFVLLWSFLFSVTNFNLFLLFIIMEAITLAVVVASTIYLVYVGAQLLHPVLYFFVLNVIMATFYIFGTSLYLYIALPEGATTVSYSSFLHTWETWFSTYYNITAVEVFTKLILIFLLIIFFFKLTLAPFSVWVSSVYQELPFIFLCIIMTVYKIVFCCLSLTLFISVIDLIPVWHYMITDIVLLLLFPSFFIGCLAFRLQNLKTILALTTVSQFGYIIAGLIMSNPEAAKLSFFYLFIYCLQIFGLFGLLIWIKPYLSLTHLQHLLLVQIVNRRSAVFFLIIFFNLAGIPPLLGFFLKYWLFLQYYNAGFFIASGMGLLSGFFMTILYLQIALQLKTPISGYLQTLKLEQSKRIYLELAPDFAAGRLYQFLEKNFFFLSGFNVLASFITQAIITVLDHYTVATYYRITQNAAILLTKPYSNIYKRVAPDTWSVFFTQTRWTLFPYFEETALMAWHPEEVDAIIQNCPRLQVLIKFQLEGQTIHPEHWLGEFSAHGIDYSSYILAKTQLEWPKHGGSRLTMHDFEPFFKREKNVSDLVFLLEQYAGPYNLRGYEPHINLRHFTYTPSNLPEDETWRTIPINELTGPLKTFDEVINHLHTELEALHISPHHVVELERSFLGDSNVPGFDTHLLWYHLDHGVIKDLCEKIVKGQIPYNEFIHYLMSNGIAWDYYAHALPSLKERIGLVDWVYEADLAYAQHTLNECILQAIEADSSLPPDLREHLHYPYFHKSLDYRIRKDR